MEIWWNKVAFKEACNKRAEIVKYRGIAGRFSDDAKVEQALANGCMHVINSSTDDVVAKVRELTSGAGELSTTASEKTPSTFRSTASGGGGLLVCLGTASGPERPIAPPELVMRGSLYLTRPALADYIANPDDRGELVGELFDHVAARRIKVEVNQRYRLADAADAHRDLESRCTTGSSVFTVE